MRGKVNLVIASGATISDRPRGRARAYVQNRGFRWYAITAASRGKRASLLTLGDPQPRTATDLNS